MFSAVMVIYLRILPTILFIRYGKAVFWLFEVKQKSLCLQASCVSSQLTVASNDSVARHKNAYGISSVGISDGADGLGYSEHLGELKVGHAFPVWDALKPAPHLLLKFCAGKRDGCVELSCFAPEILVQFVLCRFCHAWWPFAIICFEEMLNASVNCVSRFSMFPVAQA